MLEYDDFVEGVQRLEFIPDRAAAEAAVKAVLGILASELEEPQAERLVGRLPDPLNLERLRSHQAKTTLMVSVVHYVREIAAQFSIDEDQAAGLVVRVLALMKQSVGADVIEDMKSGLPEDWDDLIDQA